MQNVKTDPLKGNDSIKHALRDLLGDTGFCDDAETLALMSSDIWDKGQPASFVISPTNLEELSHAVRIAHKHDVALNPRGAGMSYTKSHTPANASVGLVDFSQMNRILEINPQDMYVTVEAGCTWDALYQALKPLGLRTPFWGPMSGLVSTIGGGLSQNNAFFGAGIYGSTGDSVLCLTVVLGDGTIVKTGTAGTRGGQPFLRSYGPDLAGLFCGDSGALGHKADITLRLIPMPEYEEVASFEYADSASCIAAIQELMRQNLACEIFAFDPNLQRARLKRASLMADVQSLKNVVKGQGSLVKGLKEGAKVAMAGRSFVDDAKFGLHFVVEGRSQAGVAEDMERLKKIAAAHKGAEIENSIPKILRANPFNPLNSILGPEGERWVPVHGIVPNSSGAAFMKDIETLFAKMNDDLERHDIMTCYLLTTIAATGLLIEPVIFWPEEIWPIHEATVEDSFLRTVKRFDPNPQATAIVGKIRQGVMELASQYGGAHFQIGRSYPYKAYRDPESWALLERIKTAVDRGGHINPGVLGLP